MDHTEIRRKLPAYLDDDVSAEEKQEIKRHLASCGICRGALADLELTMWHLKRLPEIEPPPWLSEKIIAKVQAPVEPKPGLWRRLFYPLRVKLPLAALALVLLGSIGYFVYRTLRPEMIPSGPSPTLRETTSRPAPVGKPSPLSAPRPLRAPVPALTPTPHEAPAAAPPLEVAAPPSAPAHMPAVTPAPVPGQHEEPELRPADETALPEREAVQPFGREEPGATQDEKR